MIFLNSQYSHLGYWTGKRVVFTFLVLSIALFFASGVILYRLTNESTSLLYAKNSISSDNPLPYDNFEIAMSNKFNEFYFGVASACARKLMSFDLIIEIIVYV